MIEWHNCRKSSTTLLNRLQRRKKNDDANDGKKVCDWGGVGGGG